MAAELSRSSIRNYRSAWEAFERWCAEAACAPLPASVGTVSDFVLWCINQHYRIATVDCRISAIAHYHRKTGLESPVTDAVHELIRLARRDLKEKPAGKRALTPAQLRQMLRYLSGSHPLNVRNRAILLLAFATGWRRSEVSPLDLADVRFSKKGMTLWQGSSKTDQQGVGRTVAIHFGCDADTCPVRAVQAWIKVRGPWAGPLFVRACPAGVLTQERFNERGDIVHTLVKGGLKQIGADPTEYGAHSTRAGMITASAENGADPIAIMQRTGHKRIETVMRYVRPAQAFQRDPLAGVL